MSTPSHLEHVTSSDADQWSRLLDAQDGVFHRRDIPGDMRREFERNLRRGRWSRRARDVFVTHNGPLTRRQQEWVVLNAAPARSALSGLTAAAVSGLRGFEPADGLVHVTVPCGTSMPRVAVPTVVVHYSRFLDAEDVHPLHQPRRTRIARSVLDAAAWASTDRAARAVVLASVQQRLATADLLSDALPRRGPCLRHALIAETIADAAGGVASVPEREVGTVMHRFGLPEPSRQRIVKGPSGRYYLDVDWQEFGLAAEVDGMPHMRVRDWEADLDRMNEIVIDHRTLLRFTSYSVRHRPSDVGRTLTRALLSRGWTGRLT
ncbi:MAG TPA: hypothetical protein VFZ37_10965 [Jiangellaceae bacterium]